MKYFAIVLCLTGYSIAAKLPSFIEVCKPKHTDVSKCILKNIENLRPKLRENGVAEMAIPSLNPLVIPHADIKLGGDFEAGLKNIKLWRLHEFEIEDLKVDLETIRIDLKVKFPKVDVIADYRVKGQLLVLKLDGTGPGQINITNLVATVVALAKREKVDGKDHIKLTSLEITPEVGHLDLVLENLFPKNAELSDNANKLLSENQKVIVEEFSPLVVNVIKEFLTSVISNIFGHYSYDVLFPDD